MTDQILHGGKHDRKDLFIEPTLLTDVSMDSKIMQVRSPPPPPRPPARRLNPRRLTPPTPCAAHCVAQEEIFGPVLPIIPVSTLDEAIAIVQKRDKPLALYLFSKSDAVRKQVLANTTSGGVCINDTLFHIANPHLPFGGTCLLSLALA